MRQVKCKDEKVKQTKTAPNLAIVVLDSENLSQVLDGGRKLILRSQNTRNGKHRRDRHVVEAQCSLISLRRTVKLPHHFREGSCTLVNTRTPPRARSNGDVPN